MVRSLDFGREREARETLKVPLWFCVRSMASNILHVHLEEHISLANGFNWIFCDEHLQLLVEKTHG